MLRLYTELLFTLVKIINQENILPMGTPLPRGMCDSEPDYECLYESESQHSWLQHRGEGEISMTFSHGQAILTL